LFRVENNHRILFLGGVQNIFNLLDTQLDLNLIGRISNLSLFIFKLLCSDLLSLTPPNGTVEPKAITNARNLYESCIDEVGIETDGVEPVLEILKNEFGGWPILEGAAWNATTFNLSDILLKLRRYDNEIIFSVATATNQENSSVYDIEVSIIVFI
jgi:hypothetical protein